MNITLYTFNKRANSTKTPTADQPGTMLDVVLKEGTSIYNPSFTVSNFNTKHNYIKWDNRYYFVVDVTLVRFNVYQVDCVIDLLRTYKSNIMDLNAFVDYSASNYNNRLIDNRISIDPAASFHSNAGLLITDGSTTGSGGTYIIDYVTDSATYGCGGVLWTNYQQASNVSQALTNTDFLELTNFEKIFNNAYQAIKGCRYVPCGWWSTSSADKHFVFGSWDSGALGASVKQKVEYSVTVNIPWQYNDFRRLNPYTSVVIYLPGYGFVSLDNSDIYNKSNITVKLTIDGVTGEGTYIIENLFKGTCNFAVNIAVGTVQSNIIGVATGALQAASGFLAGGAIGAIPGVLSRGIANVQRQLGNIGSNGSLSALLTSTGSDWRNVYVICISHNTNVSPDTVAATMGRPLQEVKRLGDLTGYCQTSGASIEINNTDLAQQINNLLDGGVFIE